MTGLGVIAWLLVGLALLPVGVILGIVLRQTLVHQRQAMPEASLRALQQTTLRPAVATPERVAVGEMARVAQPYLSPNNYIAPDDFARAAFDYTIRRHPAAQPRPITDRGGFAVVPLLLFSRRGASYLTHRKICLN